MLIKASDIIGLRVFTLREGKKIDVIEDVVYHPKLNKIEALLVDPGGWFSEAKVILFHDVSKIGKNAVLIDTADILKKVSDVKGEIEFIVKSDKYLAGARVITEEGTALGKVTDIYFDNETGLVEEFEVSREEEQARIRVKIEDIITIGEDATIVRVPQKEAGWQESKDRERLQESISPIRQQTTKILADAQEKIKEASEKIRKVTQPQPPPVNTKSKIIERRKREVVGLYLTKNILTQEDRMLAKEGEMVTNRLLQKAEESDVLEQVLNNVVPRMSLAP
jgi:uncharacterized protein YrrD